MKSGALLNGKTEMDMNDFIEMLQVSIDGIMKRGKAVKGEKTMLDAMIPAHDAIKASYEADGDAKKALDAGVKPQKKVSNIQRQLLRQRVVQATLEKEVSDTRIRCYFIYINA